MRSLSRSTVALLCLSHQLDDRRNAEAQSGQHTHQNPDPLARRKEADHARDKAQRLENAGAEQFGLHLFAGFVVRHRAPHAFVADGAGDPSSGAGWGAFGMLFSGSARDPSKSDSSVSEVGGPSGALVWRLA